MRPGATICLMLAKRAKRSIRVTVTPISRRRGHSGPPPMPIDGRYASSFGFNHPTIRSRRSVIGKLRWCCKLKQASTEYLYMKCNVESLQDVPLDPLQLGVAARLAYPDGSMTASGLRKEAERGRLAIERVAGKDYTTLSAIAEMREKCLLEPKGCGSGLGRNADQPVENSSPERPGSQVRPVMSFVFLEAEGFPKNFLYKWSKKRICASSPRTVRAPFSAYGSPFNLGPWP